MMIPEALFARNRDTNEIACSVSLVPTFEAVAPHDFLDLLNDEKPVATKLSNGNDFHFIFVVDRSGSMSFGGLPH